MDNDSQLCKDSSNADGTTHKGLFEILQERGDDCMAVDGKAMTKTCSKQRRRELNFATDHACDCGVRCCLENTLRWEPDFAAQKCKLEEACDSVGVTFTMMMICHPECNPIEGTTLLLCTLMLNRFRLMHKPFIDTLSDRLLELY
jgi:hypothetical protein